MAVPEEGVTAMLPMTRYRELLMKERNLARMECEFNAKMAEELDLVAADLVPLRDDDRLDRIRATALAYRHGAGDPNG